jgi:gamma-glutamylcyclotransferase (GGCT)/AIG2-like uncharacterized protein YtfP
MESILYFAYGSNMLTWRLQARCPSARVIGVANLPNYRLSFAKLSVDKSGKATLLAVSDPEARVYGVVFDIAAKDLNSLDAIEGRGKGYDRLENLAVFSHPNGDAITVTTYIADNDALDYSLQPYDWYLNLVVAGAEQHQLPADYIHRLRGQPSQADPLPDRKNSREAIELLRKGQPR